MNGGADVFPESLERFQEYLHRLARSRLGRRYSAKLDPSDLVQETFLDALQKSSQFRGATERERAAWLRAILASNLADVFRDFTRQKRDVTRERSFSGLSSWLEELPAPLHDETEGNGQLLRLAWALSELPEPQRIAIELHHLQGLSLAQTAHVLQRTEASVAGLVRRGLTGLRELLVVPAG